MKRVVFALFAALLAAAGVARADNPAEVVELGQVGVVGTSPLPGLGIPLEKVPANVQAIRLGSDRDRFGALAGTIDQLAAGTGVSSGQGNPFQPDFTFRGFVASPLLGQPQGISVFQDGVRLNEPFGDVMNWDLVPAGAVGAVQLVPGSAPLFGPNAMGGVVALYTRSGAQFPGGAAEVQGGSFGRRAFEVRQGGQRGAWDWFATADALHDDGWAAHNPSLLRRGFVKVGRQDERSDLDLSLTLADNVLQGSQALPVSYLGDIRQPYTWPDVNRNRAAMLALKGSRFTGDGVLIGGTAYWRRFRNENFSSNVNGDAGEGAPQGSNDLATVNQSASGGGLQLTIARPLAGRDNTLMAGVTVDVGHARYVRLEQPARFDAARQAVATGPFAPDTDALATTRRYGLLLSDTLALAGPWSLTVSGRQDVSEVRIADRSGSSPDLEGSHRYSRFNPAIGLTREVQGFGTLYASHARGMRAPTPMELTCADPAAPCKLPNAFLADPPLGAVLTRTTEAGARGHAGERTRWSFAFYRTAVDDDIQFVSSDAGASTTGYFRNVGATQRQGIELGLDLEGESASLALRYSHVEATFRSGFREASPNNASADGSGSIEVRSGSRIPGIPRDTVRLTLSAGPWGGTRLRLDLAASARQWARGDENNADPSGAVPGYAVAGLQLQGPVAHGLEWTLAVENLFDTRYARSGVLGRNYFANAAQGYDPAASRLEAFRGPSAPRAAWLSLRWHWD